MTGPEHYRQAEQLIGSVTKRDALSGARILAPGNPECRRDVLALAQVHATLALAAATALAHAGEMHYADDEAWQETAATANARKAEAARGNGS
jgi:hypothetical protein